MNEEKFFIMGNKGFCGRVYKYKDRQIVVLNSDVNKINEENLDIHSNLSGVVHDKELMDSIIDCLKCLKFNEKDSEENVPIYKWEDAVNFIAERCEVNKDIIEKVLDLEEEYMRSIGIIEES